MRRLITLILSPKLLSFSFFFVSFFQLLALLIILQHRHTHLSNQAYVQTTCSSTLSPANWSSWSWRL